MTALVASLSTVSVTLTTSLLNVERGEKLLETCSVNIPGQQLISVDTWAQPPLSLELCPVSLATDYSDL